MPENGVFVLFFLLAYSKAECYNFLKVHLEIIFVHFFRKGGFYENSNWNDRMRKNCSGPAYS